MKWQLSLIMRKAPSVHPYRPGGRACNTHEHQICLTNHHRAPSYQNLKGAFKRNCTQEDNSDCNCQLVVYCFTYSQRSSYWSTSIDLWKIIFISNSFISHSGKSKLTFPNSYFRGVLSMANESFQCPKKLSHTFI